MHSLGPVSRETACGNCTPRQGIMQGINPLVGNTPTRQHVHHLRPSLAPSVLNTRQRTAVSKTWVRQPIQHLSRNFHARSDMRTLRCSRRLREHQPLVISGAARLIMVLQQGKFSLGHRRHPFQRSPTRLAPALWHAQPKRETRSMTATQGGGHSAPRASLGRICRTWL